MSIRLLVCGGRTFDDINFLTKILFIVHEKYKIDAIIEGEAAGADTLAKLWSEEVIGPAEGYPADWRKHGKRAGPVRNKQMLVEGQPDAVLAFPGGRGTDDMINQSRGAHLPVWAIKQVLFKKEDPKLGFLSNFDTKHPVIVDSERWKSAEHFYQAMKNEDSAYQNLVKKAETPSRAKYLGSNVPLRDDWEDIKIDVMRIALEGKFAEGSEAARLLGCTGIDYLVEYAPWGDAFWGMYHDTRGNLIGQNHLGKLLMERKLKLFDLKDYF